MNKKKKILVWIGTTISFLAFVAIGLSLTFYTQKWVVLTIVAAAYIFNSLFAFYIFNSNKRTYKVKASWIMVIVGLPLIGPLLFMIFGVVPFKHIDWKERSVYDKKLHANEDLSFSKNEITNPGNECFKLPFFGESLPIYKDNKITPIENNLDIYKEFIKLITSAKKSVWIQTYILEDGVFCKTVMTILAKKAQEGLDVRLLFDWGGSYKKHKNRDIKELKKLGVKVGLFNPSGFNKYKSATNFRCHRKVAIVDNQKMIYGGSNIGDDYFNGHEWYCYLADYNAIVEGKIVNTFSNFFAKDWRRYTFKSLNEQEKEEIMKAISKNKPISCLKNSMLVQGFSSGPQKKDINVEKLLIDLILNAKKNINLVTPYFVPSDEFVSALVAAAHKNVVINIYLPSQYYVYKKNWQLFLLQREFYKILLNNKINVFEHISFIHSKLITIDDDISLIPTFNIDYRSFIINFESSLTAKDKSLCAKNKDIFKSIEHDSKRITLNTPKSKLFLFWSRKTLMNILSALY